MMRVEWLLRLRAGFRSAVWRACLVAPRDLVRPLGLVLGATALGAAPLLAWQAPALLQAHTQAQARVQDLQAQVQSLQAQLAQPPAPPAAPSHDAPTAWTWQQLARDSGLQIVQFKPVTPEGAGSRQMRLVLRGRYAQHGAWLAALTRQPLRVTSYQLQAGEAGFHRAELVMELPAPLAPALPVAPALRHYGPAPHLDPLGEPAPVDPRADLPEPWRAEFQRPRQWLEGAALSELALAGTLRRDQSWVALVRWDRMVHSVRVGDYLGRDLGRIERIDEQGLWLREIVRADGGPWRLRERHWRVGEHP